MSAVESLRADLRDDRMPSFGPLEWGLRPSKGTVGLGLAGAAAAVACVMLFSVQDMLVARAPQLAMSARGRGEAGPPVARPPDEAQVGRAFERVRDIFDARGVPALASEGQACFAALQKRPDYGQLDFCLAFDAFAGGVADAAGPGSADAASYFNEATVRHIRALDAVGASQTDARARVQTISRLAAGVGRARPAIVPPPPLEPEELEPLEPEPLPPPAGEETPYVTVGPEGVIAPPPPTVEPAPAPETAPTAPD